MTADKDDRPRVAFLFGAGASIPAGMPSTKQITERVLSGENVSRHSDGQYYFGPPLYAHMGWSDDYVPKIMILLELLHQLASDYYCNDSDPRVNYEILYSLASQAYDDLVGEFDNPAIGAFEKRIISETLPKLASMPHREIEKWTEGDITRETTAYIHDVATNELRECVQSWDHLAWFVEACKCDSIMVDYILTLNHDTILEQCLAESDIPFVDGFLPEEDDLYLWKPELFDSKGTRKLLKIHGSLDWFAFMRDDLATGPAIIAKTDERDIYHTKQMLWPREPRPLMLIGTANKLLRYTSGIFAELYYRMIEGLRSATHLVVTGYSFGDKAINNRVIDFLLSSTEKRMIIAHPNPTSLRSNARRAIQYNLPEFQKQGRVEFIPKRIEDVTWQEIKDRIEP